MSRANKIRLLNIVISISATLLLLLALNFVVPGVLAGDKIPGGGIPR
ncbi:MAG: hypothetical protein QXF09_01195 [Nitrososphaerota archaeon]